MQTTTDDRGENGGAPDCGAVRDLLPLQLSRELSGSAEREVRTHLDDCRACRAELAFLERLRAARPEPPASLVPSVLERLGEGLGEGSAGARRPRGPAWALSAAAVAVLALGMSLFWTDDSAPGPTWSVALDYPSAAWHDDDWVVAGEPVLDALSDDVLRTLLREMEE